VKSKKIGIIAKLKLFIDLTIIVIRHRIFFVIKELIKTVIILKLKFLAPSWITF